MPTGSVGTANTNPVTAQPSSLPALSGGNLPSDNLSHYNVWQLAELALAAGFNEQSVVAAAVATAESSGNPTAVRQDSNGTHDVGLWQVNSVHGYSDSDMEVPSKNVAAAYEVYKSSGWGAWTTYSSGAYKKYLLSPQQISKLVQQGTLNESQAIELATAASNTEPSSVQSAATTVANAAGGIAGTFGGLVGNLTSGSFWIMVLKILAGVVLIGVGLYMLVKGSNG